MTPSGAPARISASIAVARMMVGACTQWRAVPLPTPRAFPPDQEIQVWHRGGNVRITSVVVTPDSVRGITSDQTRFAAARVEVDSIRVAGRDQTTPVILGILALAALVAVLIADAIGRGAGGN